jgi:hypothetical protein
VQVVPVAIQLGPHHRPSHCVTVMVLPPV